MNSEELHLYKTLKAMVTTQMSGVITMRTMLLLSGLKKVYVPDEDSLEQRMNITVFTEIITNFILPFSSFFDKE